MDFFECIKLFSQISHNTVNSYLFDGAGTKTDHLFDVVRGPPLLHYANAQVSRHLSRFERKMKSGGEGESHPSNRWQSNR